jgi:hypothetical protein
MIQHYIKEFRDKFLFEEENTIESVSDMDKIISDSPKIRNILIKLFSGSNSEKDAVDDIKSIVSDIKCIQRKPTTFRVVLKNGANLDIKYTPTPLQLKNPEDYGKYDGFTITISGKKYRVSVNSEFDQCLTYLGKLMGEKPILKGEEPGEEEGQEAPPEESPIPDDENPGEAPEPDEKEEKPKK